MSVPHPVRACVGLLALLVAGCAATGSEPPPPLDAGEQDVLRRRPIEVTLGRGAWCFAPYADGEPIWIQRGAQGGQHLNTVILIEGLPEGLGARYRVWLVDDTGRTVLGTEQREALFEDASDVTPTPPVGSRIQRGTYLFVPDPDELIGERFTVWLQVTTDDERSATFHARGVASWLDDDMASEACGGQ